MDITNPIYGDANRARKHLEALHWPNGPVCPHCGNVDQDRITKLKGKSTRPGVYKCNECTKPFTVTVGTIFEDSKIPLNKWLLAFRLLNGGKKGISANELSRHLGITYKSAWFMAHRIREAMKDEGDVPIGGYGKTIEADETYVGGKVSNRHKAKRTGKGYGIHVKQPVVSLVEREGRVRSFHVANVNAKTLRHVLVTNADRGSWLMTDENSVYKTVGKEYVGHGVVRHGLGEYGRASYFHTNTVENFFSILKRGINGVYFHVSEAHLKRYVTEFDFRYNTRDLTDTERTAEAVKGARGKRLMYRQPSPLVA
ncbi:MAG: IS1595 family transposase [Novosphingobium sp.]|nr:IS1595 family transposase [Novosphingobium sp.]MCP5403229.1 IS1595 family transposase [Novosphingobium sp.]